VNAVLALTAVQVRWQAGGTGPVINRAAQRLPDEGEQAKWLRRCR